MCSLMIGFVLCAGYVLIGAQIVTINHSIPNDQIQSVPTAVVIHNFFREIYTDFHWFGVEV